jgi:hypothetical protein
MKHGLHQTEIQLAKTIDTAVPKIAMLLIKFLYMTLEVVVWCAVGAHQATGPIIFIKTDYDHYIKLIQAPLLRD